MPFFSRWKALFLLLVIQPVVSYALDENQADIKLSTDLQQMNVVVIPVGSGCTVGMLWDIVAGRCTSAVLLRNEATSRICSCSCPELGSCTAQQSGTFPVFGWRLPTDGRELISYNGAPSWGSCAQTSNSCYAAPVTPPPSTPATISVTALICGPGDAGYSSGPLNDGSKYLIIEAYKNHTNNMKRCPELDGFIFWQNQISTGVHTITTAMAAISTSTNPNAVIAANAACHAAAINILGAGNFITSTYQFGSGNQCSVTY